MMNNKKDDILKSIKRTENELRIQELSEDRLLDNISRYQNLSLRACERIQTISWKIAQAEFIHCCENKKQINYLSRIKRWNVATQKFGISKRMEKNVADRSELAKTLSQQLKLLCRGNTKKKEYISQTEKEVDALKERNDSAFQKLLNEIEEWENEERQLEDQLEQIQCDYEKSSFGIY